MPYLRNTWYVATWDHEITTDGMLARTLLDEPVVLFRAADGTARALLDRCPHRFAPLHMGKREGDVIECPYHGLRFDAAGRCVLNPHGEGRIPPNAKVPAYPVAERHSAIWIWMGEPEKADPDLIPDFGFMDPEDNEVGKGYLHANANYMLEVDNILDLSHVEFLHSTTLGAPGISKIDPTTTREGETVWSKRLISNHILSDLLYKLTGIEPGTLVDRWMEVRWDAPSNLLIDVGATPMGQPREGRGGSVQAHLFTPETETTTHYWYGIAFPKAWGPLAAELASVRIQSVRKPFETEDLPVIEAVQRRMGGAEFWSLKPVLLAADAAAVQARRLLEQKIRKEQAETAAA